MAGPNLRVGLLPLGPHSFCQVEQNGDASDGAHKLQVHIQSASLEGAHAVSITGSKTYADIKCTGGYIHTQADTYMHRQTPTYSARYE